MSKRLKLPDLPFPSLPTIALWVRTRQGMATMGAVAALAAILAVLAGFGFFSSEDVPDHEVSVSDVHVTNFSPGADRIDVVVDMTWSKTGAPANDCVAQVMLKSGKPYRHGTSDKQTVTMAVDGPQKITLGLPFRIPRDEYAKAGKVRIVCAASTGSRWVAFSMPEWTP